MSQYIVSARKYRPDSFETLIGQDNIVQTLKNSIIRGQLAHAYLFCGPRGVGKTSAARIFAKTINCSNPSKDMEPCGMCESCLSFQEGRSYCIHELDAASNNGVEDIKILMDQVQIPPQVGKYSVFIIDEVHMLSQAAFNAFLKTLEEPPAHAIFILATTEKHKILPTILSRCQVYDFNRISIPDIVKNLRGIATKENIKIDDESLHIIALKADGAMRDALTIFDQTIAFCGTDVKYADVLKNLNVLDYEYSFSLVDAFLKGDYVTALLKFDEVLSKGFNALHFVASLSSHFRDLIVSKSGGTDALLELPDSLKKRYKEQAEKCSLQFLFDSLTVTTQCESGYKLSVNPRLHIEYALMKLAFLSGGVVTPSASPMPPKVVAATPAVAPKTAVPAPKVEATVPAPTAEVPAKKVAKPAEAPKVEVPVSKAETPKADVPVEKPEGSKAEVPVEAQKKAEAPKRRIIAPIKAPVSIEKIVSNTVDVKDVVPENIGDGAIPDDETLKSKWIELANLYSDRPRLSNTLSTAILEFSQEEEDGYKVITFKVQNESQRAWIEEKLIHSLEDKFCKLINCGKIRLRVSVIPDTQVQKKIYMPEDKAKDLMKQNDQVKNLVKDLDLGIK
jgi:DNA polymerase-3 subunit gamma/tau